MIILVVITTLQLRGGTNWPLFILVAKIAPIDYD